MAAKTKTKANKGGRPTKYKNEYCDEIIEYFKNEEPIGSIAGFAAKIGVCKDTIHEWRDKHQAFSDAYKKAYAFYEHKWLKGSINGDFQVAFSIFMGKNVFGYKDKLDHSLGDSDGGPLKININWGKSDDD